MLDEGKRVASPSEPGRSRTTTRWPEAIGSVCLMEEAAKLDVNRALRWKSNGQGSLRLVECVMRVKVVCTANVTRQAGESMSLAARVCLRAVGCEGRW